jgi:hypothetical protein
MHRKTRLSKHGSGAAHWSVGAERNTFACFSYAILHAKGFDGEDLPSSDHGLIMSSPGCR